MKGQVTVEFLVVLVVMILLFTAVSMDLSDFSIQNAMTTQTNELMRASESSLLSSAKLISTQGTGAKKTVSIRAPSDCAFLVLPKSLKLECRESSFSYKDYNEETFAVLDPALPVTYSVSGGKIENGETGLVKVQRT